MRILLLVFICGTMLSACSGKKNEQARNKGKQTEVTKGKKKPEKAKISKPDFYKELQKNTKLTVQQINDIKQADNQLRLDIKGKKGDDRKKIRQNHKAKIESILKERKELRSYRQFDQDWNNPLSYYNLKRELNLKKSQIKAINQIKKESRNAIKEIKATDDQRKVSIAKIQRSEIDKILTLLTDKQKKTFDKIKSNIPKERISKLGIFE